MLLGVRIHQTDQGQYLSSHFTLLLNVRVYRCEKVVVATFGSIASGLDTPTSDIDLVLKVGTVCRADICTRIAIYESR
jgi:DNA polymerase sigma